MRTLIRNGGTVDGTRRRRSVVSAFGLAPNESTIPRNPDQ